MQWDNEKQKVDQMCMNWHLVIGEGTGNPRWFLGCRFLLNFLFLINSPRKTIWSHCVTICKNTCEKKSRRQLSPAHSANIPDHRLSSIEAFANLKFTLSKNRQEQYHKQWKANWQSHFQQYKLCLITTS